MSFSFGKPATSTATPAFGSSFSFGANASNTNTAGTTGTAGAGLFGQPAAAQPSTGTGTGLFGNTGATGATGTTGGGLFGNTNPGTTGASATGGGLFGNTTANTAPTSAPATGGLFGAANTTGTTGGGLFGSTTTAPTNTTGGGLFGNTTATTQPSSGGLFGSTTTAPASGGLFGAQPAGPSLFSQTTTNPLAQSTLTASTLGPPSAQPTKNNLQVSVFGTPGAGGLALEQRIENIFQAWSPASPSCRFQYYFYNLVDNPQAYGRPANATNEALWKRAISENPNPDRLVPALAVGFDDLKKRTLSQEQENKNHMAALAQLRARLTATHTELSRRVRGLARQLHMLIPAVRRSALSPEEEELRRKLLALEEGAGLARLAGRMNELWAMAGSIQARGKEAGNNRIEWAVVDEDGLASIARILTDQQNGLAHVTKILQEDLRALKIIQEGVPTHN
ncbi:hypothetical protein B0J17DRAFT_662985 [Rhizoctonia solani]|nr:hypothetical protein B0J17DRAFT_662985 [Rhizoctonia solani]